MKSCKRSLGAAGIAAGIAVCVAVSFACAEQSPVAPESAYFIRVLVEEAQHAPAGAQLASPLMVQVSEANTGQPAPGVRVRFAVAAGSATLLDSIAVTGLFGEAAARLRVGVAGDTSRVIAAIAAAPEKSVSFTVISSTPPTLIGVSPSTVVAGDTVVLSGDRFSGAVSVVLGETVVIALAGGTHSRARAIVPPCLPAGALAVRVLVDGASTNPVPITSRATRAAVTLKPYEWMTVASNQLASCLSLVGEAGASYLVVPQFAAAGGAAEVVEWRLGSPLAVAGAVVAGFARANAGVARLPTQQSGARVAFERVLRAAEREVAAQLRGSRGGPPLVRSQAPAALVRFQRPPALGSLRGFNVVASLDGSKSSVVTARLRFAGDRVLVYSDTATAALSDGQLFALARLMDRDLEQTATSAFGSVPDIDGNGRLIVLLTPAVNALVRAEDCVQRGFVTGFFYPPDLIERNARGNGGEVFYAYVTDNTGKYSCAHTEADVVRTLQAAYLHELQHLISFNEHVLARGGENEEPWLNEGLSHIAEELGSRLFEGRYPAPFGRGTTTQLFPDSAAPFIAPQMFNAYLYFYSTTQHSLTTFEGAGRLEDRGASWLFLRWLADQKGNAILRRLVQSSRRGVANVEDVAGESFGALFGDFSIALYADSLPGIARSAIPSRLRYSTRNIRQLMAREATISGFGDPFPLPTYLLAGGGALRSGMVPGTMVHTIVRSESSGAPINLTYTAPDLGPLASALAAQVSIMRLPP